MTSEIITIGDEIIIGQVIDTNSAFIAASLNEAGIEVLKITSVPDKKQSITSALDIARKTADIIIMTGGLGPTGDDITKNTLAGYFKSHLVLNKDVLEHIKILISHLPGKISERNMKQAELPDNCKIIANNYGSASGMWFEEKEKIFISLPGVTYEMKAMITNDVIPALKKRFRLPVIIHKTILTSGVAESIMADKIKDWEKDLPSTLKLAYLPSPGILRLRISGTGSSREKVLKEIDQQTDKLILLVGNDIFGYDDDLLEEIIGKLLVKRKQTVAVAESCTGGKISELITSVGGSSLYFKGSVIAYSNEIKTGILGVSEDTIEKHGAVSEEVVRAMAVNIRKIYNTDYSVASSGIAGPTGGTPQKPVGTTWICIASEAKVIASKYNLGKQRGRNILKASITALNMLRKLISNN
jgi:nicotinamide-nucleotide amidase